MKKSFFRAAAVAVLILLLLSPSLAFEGAKNGLSLWANVVLPTLLPFMICSNVIVALDAIHLLIFPVKRLLEQGLHLTAAGCYVLVSGLLCGYPMGARNVSDFLDAGKIQGNEARRLLAICNHPSPMFLLGYTAALLPAGIPVWVLLLSVYAPILPLSWLAGKVYGTGDNAEPSYVGSRGVQGSRGIPEGREILGSRGMPGNCGVLGSRGIPEGPEPPRRRLSFDESLMDSAEVMVKIGGYIMLFSILALYITKLPISLPAAKAALLGFVEITTGLSAISQAVPGAAGGLMITAAVAFGGMSGIFQTKSVMKNAGLSIRHYVVWKAIHSLLSSLVFILLACFLLHPSAA